MNGKETKKTIKIFAIASFLNDFGSDIIYPIWPLFVTSFLGANMTVLGFIDGLGDAIVSLSQAASGYISDRIQKRKIFIWVGYICGSASRLGYAVSAVWQHLIPFRILDRVGKIRSAPRDAIIADVSTNENRGTHFGILRMMDNLGAVCGILVCLLLIKPLGYSKLFMLAAIPSLIGAALVIAAIKEAKPSTEIRVFRGITFADLSRNFKLYLILSAFFALASFSYSFLLVFANEFGFSFGFVPILYLVFTAIASLVSLPFGKLADQYGRKPILFFSYILWAVICLIFIFFHSHFAIVLVFVLYGLHKGALEPVQRTFVSELAPERFRASSLGGFQMVVGLCALPSSLLAGILWDKIGISAPFYFSFFLTLLSIVILLFVKDR